MSLRPGTPVGDYQVVKKLGEGGMGACYLAVHRTLGQRVVLKGLHDEYLQDPQLSARLAREAEAMARLSHPNIVAIYNFIQAPEGAFIVMEYVDGQSFEELIHRSGLIPPLRAIELIQPVLRALDYAHGSGVLHRDLKPANIMLGFDGHVRVLDFGTAKLVDRPGLTRVGMTLGTATYMAPEQLLGRDLTAAADIYSIGVTLYEMCTGRLPFESENTAELVRMVHRQAPRPPSLHYPGIPKALDEAILRCLAKAPEERFQSARELSATLAEIAAAIAAGPQAAKAPAGEPPAAAPGTAARAGAVQLAGAAPPAGASEADRVRRAGARIAASVGASAAGVAGVVAALLLLFFGARAAGLAVGLFAALLWAAGSGALAAAAIADLLGQAAAGRAPGAAAGAAAALLPPLAAAASPAALLDPVAARMRSAHAFAPTAGELPIGVAADGGRKNLWRHARFDPGALAAVPPAAPAEPPPPAAPAAPGGAKTRIATPSAIERAVGGTA